MFKVIPNFFKRPFGFAHRVSRLASIPYEPSPPIMQQVGKAAAECNLMKPLVVIEGDKLCRKDLSFGAAVNVAFSQILDSLPSNAPEKITLMSESLDSGGCLTVEAIAHSESFVMMSRNNRGSHLNVGDAFDYVYLSGFECAPEEKNRYISDGAIAWHEFAHKLQSKWVELDEVERLTGFLAEDALDQQAIETIRLGQKNELSADIFSMLMLQRNEGGRDVSNFLAYRTEPLDETIKGVKKRYQKGTMYSQKLLYYYGQYSNLPGVKAGQQLVQMIDREEWIALRSELKDCYLHKGYNDKQAKVSAKELAARIKKGGLSSLHEMEIMDMANLVTEKHLMKPREIVFFQRYVLARMHGAGECKPQNEEDRTFFKAFNEAFAEGIQPYLSKEAANSPSARGRAGPSQPDQPAP